MSERIDCIVSGRVQMVMYRDFATRKARSLALVGQAKNLKDGTVHVVAEGSREKLERYIKKLKKGSLLSSVEAVEVSWGDPTGEYKTFTIAYD